MSWVALGTVAVGAIAGGVQGAQGASASKDAAASQYYAGAGTMSAFKKMRDQLLKGDYLGKYGLTDVFGDKPDAVLYDPINLDEQLFNAARGNTAANPFVSDLISGTNALNQREDLARVSNFLPEFTRSLSSYEGATRDLIEGRLPFEDVLGITSNQAELGASLGTAGTRTNATLKDLGIARLSAIEKGGGMFQNMLGSLASSVSPLSSQFLAQGSYLTPQNRVNTELQQAQLNQQSGQSAAFMAAAPDPGISQLWNTNFALRSQLAGVQGAASALPSAGSAGWTGAGMGALNGLMSYFTGGMGGVGGGYSSSAGSSFGSMLGGIFGGGGGTSLAGNSAGGSLLGY